MLALSLNTYLHLLSIISIFCALVAELILIQEEVNWSRIKRLSKIDGVYGIAAILVLGTGFVNWMILGKGAEYYNSNTFFILKIVFFSIVGLISLYPTIQFARLKKKHKSDPPETIQISKHKLIRKCILIELVIMSSIPLLAELMANGLNF